MNNRLLGKRFAELRQGMSISQDYLAGFSGVSKNTISEFETGKRDINTRTLNALLETLGAEIAFTKPVQKDSRCAKMTRVQRAIYSRVRTAGRYSSLYALTDELDLDYSHAYNTVRAMEAAGVLRVEKPGRDLVLSIPPDVKTVL